TNLGGKTPIFLNYTNNIFLWSWISGGSSSNLYGYGSGYYIGIPYKGIYKSIDSFGQVNEIPIIGFSYNISNIYDAINNINPLSSTKPVISNGLFAGTGFKDTYNIRFPMEKAKDTYSCSGSWCVPFAPYNNRETNYNPNLFYGVFYVMNWFAQYPQYLPGEIDIYPEVNGNIYGESLYIGDSLPTLPPSYGKSPIIAKSYYNAYLTTYKVPGRIIPPFYLKISGNEISFIKGTFGYRDTIGGSIEEDPIVSNITYYQQDKPFIFISAGSGGEKGILYLNWIIVTFGFPYVIEI
ncbi:MAG: hypothetical protein ACP5G1_04685, partial [Nanopusillaceae archaeon]